MTTIQDIRMTGMTELLDREFLLDFASKTLSREHSGYMVTGGEILDIRYRPGSDCTVLYRLKLRSLSGGRSTDELLTASLLSGDQDHAPIPGWQSERYLQEAAGRPFSRPEYYIREPRILIRVFPIDQGLPWLFDALDAKVMKQHIKTAWQDEDLRVLKVAPGILSYTPNSRAALRLDVEVEGRDGGGYEKRELIAKLYPFKSPARLFADAWALWKASNGRIGLAKPYGYVSGLQMTLQEKVAGDRLGGLAGGGAFEQAIRHTARAMACLHGLSFPLFSRRLPEREMKSIRRWGGVIAAIRPDMADRVERLQERLVAEVESRAVMYGPVHGDFHHTNVLVDGRRVTIIDLDEMAFGDSLVDVGRLLASLRVPAIRVTGSPQGLSDAGEAFLAEYLGNRKEDERRVRLYEAASLLTSAASAFRIQRQGWEDTVPLILDESERLLDESIRQLSLPAPQKRTRQSLPYSERYAWSTEETYMKATLSKYVNEAYSAELVKCRVLRSSCERNSYRVRYHLEGQIGGRKWVNKLDGLSFAESNTIKLVKALEEIRHKLDPDSHGHLLPAPKGYLSRLSMAMLETPQGQRMAEVLNGSSGPAAAEKLAQGLAALHSSESGSLSSWSISDELRELESGLDSLKSVNEELHSRTNSIFEECRPVGETVARLYVPVVRSMDPGTILIANDSIAITRVERLCNSHPLLDVGAFLAELRLRGLKRKNIDMMDRLADRFKSSYFRNGGEIGENLPFFEAICTLKLLVEQAAVAPKKRVFSRLAEYAAQCLALVSR